MDREAWCTVAHGVAQSRTWLSYWTELNWNDIIMYMNWFKLNSLKTMLLTFTEEEIIWIAPIFIEEILFIVTNSPTKRRPNPEKFNGGFYQRNNSNFIQIFLERRRNTFQLILWGHPALPDTKAREDIIRRENYRPISFMYIDTKTLNKILTNATVHKKDNTSWPYQVYAKNASLH